MPAIPHTRSPVMEHSRLTRFFLNHLVILQYSRTIIILLVVILKALFHHAVGRGDKKEDYLGKDTYVQLLFGLCVLSGCIL